MKTYSILTCDKFTFKIKADFFTLENSVVFFWRGPKEAQENLCACFYGVKAVSEEGIVEWVK